DMNFEHKVLDGGLATQLIRQGYDNLDNDPLWSCRLLNTAPWAIKQAHLSFLEGGADIIETNTYQASIESFIEHFTISEEEAVGLIKDGARIAIEARDEFWRLNSEKCSREGRQRPLVAASIGPYGATLHDGSEYSGHYVDTMSIEDLKAWHKRRIDLLADSGIDILACETIPALREAEALVRLLSEYPHLRAWISFSCKDNQHINHGELFSDVVAKILSYDCKQVLGIGINCTDPEFIEPLLKSVQNFRDVTKFVIYPNSGETWTAEHTWTGKASLKGLDEYVDDWMDLGATYIGGCCRVYPEDTNKIRSKMNQYFKLNNKT
ncbi:unnamed protein product, partial [Owenia fusiformis]